MGFTPCDITHILYLRIRYKPFSHTNRCQNGLTLTQQAETCKLDTGHVKGDIYYSHARG